MSDVYDELAWDPKIDNGTIAVSADNGNVTLRGTVGSRARSAGRRTTRSVCSVSFPSTTSCKVKPMNDPKREDAELRGDVLHALMLNSCVPETVDATAKGGVVTLTGSGRWQYQREEAESVAASIAEAFDVIDEIELKISRSEKRDAKEGIMRAFERNARLNADDLHVWTSNRTVTIEGTVRSWAEHDEAIDAAWAAPGVKHVHDRIAVAY